MSGLFTTLAELPKRRLLLAAGITLVSLVALGVASYLTWTTWQQQEVAGCTGAEHGGCDEVLDSQWSKWLGLPVSLFGALTYVGILGLCWPAVKRPSGIAATALLATALLAAGSAVWFILVQAFMLELFCPYCMVVHTCSLLVLPAAFFMLMPTSTISSDDRMRNLLGVAESAPEPEVHEGLSPMQPLMASGVAVVGLVLLVAGQTFYTPPSSLEMVFVESETELVVESEEEQHNDEQQNDEQHDDEQHDDEQHDDEQHDAPSEEAVATQEDDDFEVAISDEPAFESGDLSVNAYAADLEEDSPAQLADEVVELEAAFVTEAPEIAESAATEQLADTADSESPEFVDTDSSVELTSDPEPDLLDDLFRDPSTDSLADTDVPSTGSSGFDQPIGQDRAVREGFVFDELFGEIPITANNQSSEAEANEEQLPEVEQAASVSDPDEVSPSEADPAVQEAKPAGRERAKSRVLRFSNLKRPVDVVAGPVIGNPHAEFVFVEMIDYTCAHCRKFHEFAKESLDRYGDQIAFVIYHVPLSKKCNPGVQREQAIHRDACEYAKLAAAVWKLAPKHFPEFHNWLMTGPRAPSAHEARRRAMDLAGEAVFTDSALNAELTRRFSSNGQEWRTLEVGLPLLLSEKGMIRGIPKSAPEWFRFLETQFGLTPVNRDSE